MNLTVPANPKLYHIVHLDRLESILSDQFIWSDSESRARSASGTVIGMGDIKDRRLHELNIDCHSELFVGQCVPFYFCPRSVMLYVISKANHPGLGYSGGQGPILHLEYDLNRLADWAIVNELRWAFTLSSAATSYFESRKELSDLSEVRWDAINARNWTRCRDEKQAEFLCERCVPTELIERIGVLNTTTHNATVNALSAAGIRKPVEILPIWYY